MPVELADTTVASGPDASKSKISRRRVLDAAARCFLNKGYAATRLSDIADEAGMKAGSIYYHFDSKEQMLSEVFHIGISAVFGAVRAGVEALGSDSSHRDRIGAAIKAHLEQLLEQGDYTAANIRIFGQAPTEIQRRHMPDREAYREYWRQLLEDARRDGALRDDADLSLIRMLLFGALNWTVEWNDPEKGSADRIAEAATAMLFDGLGR